MLSDEAEQVLRAIISLGTDGPLTTRNRVRAPVPGAPELYLLCELLATSEREEDFQRFFKQHIGFITGLFGTNDDSDLAVLFKPYVGTGFHADFAILQANQGGAKVHLVELEPAHERLYNQSRTPARRLAGALGQIEDWRGWLSINRQHFGREVIAAACKAPLFGKQAEDDSGIRFMEAERLSDLWRMFGGVESPFFSYTVVIGRWSKLTLTERQRLISFNNSGPTATRILTYEQVARLANARLDRRENHDGPDVEVE